ncbi:hypothetical protein [Nonomuraea sediminis]|uniref:hypothetical protein n=1 Tax=Nonomuraea sediminis TaxID=2835864 RepID=UPI001BDCC569|nr:hypothetical protein [Nonomuraea sediminis]
MGLDIHVTSRGIAHLGVRVGMELRPIFTGLSAAVPATDVAGLGFGAMGHLQLTSAYADAQLMATHFLDGAAEVVRSWEDLLQTASQNWAMAEQANVVLYQ